MLFLKKVLQYLLIGFAKLYVEEEDSLSLRLTAIHRIYGYTVFNVL